MHGTDCRTGRARRAGPGIAAWQILTAVSMTVGRGPAARKVAEAAALTAGERVIDIGCGPGTAVREAARRGAIATGVDPAPPMLRLARWISALRRVRQVNWIQGRAEELPLADGSGTVVWALSSVHHWQDRAAGIMEIRRVLEPDGRMVLAERLAKPGARGHAAHGLTPAQAEDLAREAAAAGLSDAHTSTVRAGHRMLVLIQGRRDTAQQA